ncbi:MAG: adenylate/guanylate cyclase domain-containing protein [Pseudomonadota bacterium]
MKEPAILVVDDVENNRVALTMRLDIAGYGKVAEASNGREALELMRKQDFDIVLLDIMMPEMDGYQVLEEMRVDTELRNIPVIMISAVDELDSVVRCIELGAADYLPKPFNPTLLKARVEAYVERAHHKAQEREYLERLRQERQRADEVLSAVLPMQVARVLKSNKTLPPVRYNDITVLFLDVADFTATCEREAPELVFEHLEALIQELETLTQANGLAKIKTIGDAFLATAGLLEPHDDPVRATVKCALEMVDAAACQAAGWQVRVGIDHGTVVAGVIGRTNFQYDVWGDTVNTASRIQAQASPGAVQVSGRAWQHLRGQAAGRSLGLIDLKGKEPIEVIECHGLK